MLKSDKSLSDDMWNFIKANDIRSGQDDFLILVESRITNDLLLLNNPNICSRLNLIQQTYLKN